MGDPEIGRRIRQARLEAGLTQAELAARIGLAHPQSVSNYERGVDEADSDRLRRIAEVTKRPISFFVDEPATTAGVELAQNGDGVQATMRLVLKQLEEIRAGQGEIAERLAQLEAAQSLPGRRRARGA